MSPIIVTVNHVFEVGPILGKFLETLPVADFQSIKQTIADLRSRVDAETAQGADLAREVRDLKAQVNERLTPEQAEELQAELTGLQDAISRIVADDAGTDGGTGGAGEPAPGPEPTGGGTDGATEPAPGGEPFPADGGPTP